jgi:hypothetical protein
MGVHKSACDPWAQTWASHGKMKAAPDGARNTIRGLANPSGTKVPRLKNASTASASGNCFHLSSPGASREHVSI